MYMNFWVFDTLRLFCEKLKLFKLTPSNKFKAVVYHCALTTFGRFCEDASDVRYGTCRTSLNDFYRVR